MPKKKIVLISFKKKNLLESRILLLEVLTNAPKLRKGRRRINKTHASNHDMPMEGCCSVFVMGEGWRREVHAGERLMQQRDGERGGGIGPLLWQRGFYLGLRKSRV